MRTRFAPSPTGSLHVGGLRTALYGYLIARQTDGQFLLRIEDTDQAREVEGAVDVILKGLHWAGMDPDEGVVMVKGLIDQKGDKGPYKQSQRLEIYRGYVDKLLADKHAYPCFCTPERLEEMRNKQQAMKQAPMYDRHCLHLDPADVQKRIDAGEKHVIRMKMPHDRTITFDDDIRGSVSFAGKTIDDQVLLKSDGFPTYHLAHVVDDYLMEIDLVIRGEEWLPSLPKHLMLFEMLGWQPPRYAHVPLLLNKDKTKLSKRQNSVSVEEYIDKGYLPEAMINFLAMLGWNGGTTQEIFTMKDLIDQFSLDRVQKSGAIFDLEKLDWLQGQWMRKLTLAEFVKRIRPLVESAHPEAAKDNHFEKKAALIQERITFFHEAPDMLGYFYTAPTVPMELIASKKQKIEESDVPMLLTTLHEILDAIPDNDWYAERILNDVKMTMEKKSLKLGQLLWPLRAALTGREYSPGAVEVAEVLGKEEVMRRLKHALTNK
jgi:nondiscriminating glutamyl-tRNA synthetase